MNIYSRIKYSSLYKTKGVATRLAIWFSIIYSKNQAQNDTALPSTKQKGNHMNWDQVEGKWDQLKGKAKEKWGKLTDDDWKVAEGKRDQLAGKIQERYGYTKEQAEKELDDWIDKA